MRLPYLQVDGDFITQKARTVAALLGCSHAQAVGHLSLLWAWTLSQGSDDAPPSGLITGQHAARIVRAAAGWEGAAEAFVDVLSDPGVGLLERLPDGFRVRGMERYRKAWDKQRKDRDRKADVRRNSSGHPSDGAGKTQTQTQTQKEEAASQAPAVAAPGVGGEELPDATEDAQEVRPALVLEAQQPEKPGRRQSAGEALYARLEARRQEACRIDGVPFVESRWAHGRQNRELGPLAKAEKADAEGETWKRFVGAWLAFMEDDEAAKLDVPYSLDYFWRMRSRYEGRALRGAA